MGSKCQEWRESLPRELDFCHERAALERAGSKLREVGGLLGCDVNSPVREHCSWFYIDF